MKTMLIILATVAVLWPLTVFVILWLLTRKQSRP